MCQADFVHHKAHMILEMINKNLILSPKLMFHFLKARLAMVIYIVNNNASVYTKNFLLQYLPIQHRYYVVEILCIIYRILPSEDLILAAVRFKAGSPELSSTSQKVLRSASGCSLASRVTCTFCRIHAAFVL